MSKQFNVGDIIESIHTKYRYEIVSIEAISIWPDWVNARPIKGYGQNVLVHTHHMRRLSPLELLAEQAVDDFLDS